MLNTDYEAEYRPPSPDPARIAAHQNTCLLFGCEDLEAAYRHLRAHGVHLKEPTIARYSMKQLWCKDPDGYGLCFEWPVRKEGLERWAQDDGLGSKSPA